MKYSRAISADTYKKFMKRYKLRLTKTINGKYKPKTMRQMSKEIYDYESNHGLYEDGLYFLISH